MLTRRTHGEGTASITSDTALAFNRSMLHRFDVDWLAHGFDDAALDELSEFCLRVLYSFLVDRSARHSAHFFHVGTHRAGRRTSRVLT